MFPIMFSSVKRNVYIQSNLQNAFDWIYTREFQNNVFGVVGHSQIAAKFFNNNNITTTDSQNKEISFHLKNGQTAIVHFTDAETGNNIERTFLYTRHLHSCSNALAEWNLFSKSQEIDPHGTVNGMIHIVENVQNYDWDQVKMFASIENVYVSCMLRTWETALLLYGQAKKQHDSRLSGNKNHKIVLIVTPFLKEVDQNIALDGGNFPFNPSIQLDNFMLFLNNLVNVDNELKTFLMKNVVISVHFGVENSSANVIWNEDQNMWKWTKTDETLFPNYGVEVDRESRNSFFSSVKNTLGRTIGKKYISEENNKEELPKKSIRVLRAQLLNMSHLPNKTPTKFELCNSFGKKSGGMRSVHSVHSVVFTKKRKSSGKKKSRKCVKAQPVFLKSTKKQ